MGTLQTQPYGRNKLNPFTKSAILSLPPPWLSAVLDLGQKRLAAVAGCSRTEEGRLVGYTVVLNSPVDSRWLGRPEDRYQGKEEVQKVEDLQI